MTEHDSEELFEDLRRKLQDYGSHPSEDVWQGIRQQLPPVPPAPKPALRSRRRWLAAFLLLLLGIVTTVLVIQPSGTKKELAGRPATGKARSSNLVFTPESPQKAPSSARASSAVEREPAVASAEAPVSVKTQPLPQVATAGAARQNAAGNSAADSRITTPNRTPRQERHSALLAATSLSATSARPSSAGAATEKTVVSVRASSGSATTESGAAGSPAFAASATTSREIPGTRTASAAVAGTEPTAAPSAASPMAPTATQPESAPATATSGSTEPGSRTYSASGALAQIGSVLPLSLRAVPVRRQLPGTPLVQAVVLDSVAPRRPSRWALEVLAGPTLSYRQLGPDSANGISRYERPAAALAAQVQARYALTPRLFLAGGIGYAEYRTQFNLLLQQQQRRDSITVTRAVKQRDVYRYFTVPVQVQYQLGGQGRLQYEAQAGASLDVYAGGRTSGSTACTCEQQQNWSSAGAPYRRLGLSLTAGLGVRYALTPRLTLLAQPMGRYSVLSVSDTNTSTALPARRPFAVGLLTGFSLNLR